MMTRSKRSRFGKRSADGFTLLEVLLALAILAVGLLAIARMQMTAIQGNAEAQDMTKATKWARDKVEELMTIDFAATALADTDEDGSNGLTHTGDAADHSEVQGAYAISWNVSDNDPVNNSKTVGVTVQWQGGGRSRSVHLTCIRPELQ